MLRLNRPVMVLTPGRPSLSYRSRSRIRSPRLLALMNELNIDPDRVHASAESLEYLFTLPVVVKEGDSFRTEEYQYESGKCHIRSSSAIDNSVLPTIKGSAMCFRCRCVKILKFGAVQEKRGKRECTKCGYNGWVVKTCLQLRDIASLRTHLTIGELCRCLGGWLEPRRLVAMDILVRWVKTLLATIQRAAFVSIRTKIGKC